MFGNIINRKIKLFFLFDLILLSLILKPTHLFAATDLKPSNDISAWLNASIAEISKDYSNASTFFQNKYINEKDFDSDDLNRQYLLSLQVGNFNRALKFAKILYDYDYVQENDFTKNNKKFAAYMLIANHFRKKNYKQIIDIIDKKIDNPEHAIHKIFKSWALFGQDKPKQAIDVTPLYPQINNQAGRFFLIHHILLADALKDTKNILNIIIALEKSAHLFPQEIMPIIIDSLVVITNQNDEKRQKVATALLDFYQKIYEETNPFMANYITKQINKKPKKYKRHFSIPEAVGVLFYYANHSDNREYSPIELALTQIAKYLNNDNSFIALEITEEYALAENYMLAEKIIRNVGKNDINSIQADLLLTDLFIAQQQYDKAEKRLRSLNTQYLHYFDVISKLGQLYRTQEKYKRATSLYDDYIKSEKIPKNRLWLMYYYIGISYERSDDWDSAEKYLKQALELNPNNGFVLNYLGYSWIEKSRNLDQALEMIKKAIDSNPNNGFFIDSLGWAYYQLKQYDIAVQELERAIKIEPADPVITEHLGDAYEKTNRTLEAVYEWKKALTLEPEEKQRKILLEKIAKYIS